MQTERNFAAPPLSTLIEANPPALRENLSKTQKASVILAMLGPEAASPILRALSPTQLHSFATAITGLQQVPAPILEEVVQEFLEALRGQPDLTAGRAIARQLLGQVMDEAEVARLMDRLTTPTERMVWDQLGTMPPATLARLLQVEHPQTVAVILSELRSSEAAAVLEHLDPEIGQRAVLRLGRPPRLSPAVARILSETLEKDMLAGLRDEMNDRRPADMIAGMMNNLSSAVRDEMLRHLDKETPKLSAEVQKVMFTFPDIEVRVVARDIAQIVRAVDEDTLLTALKSASSMNMPTSKFILANISKRLAERYIEQIEAMDDVQAKEGEVAQAAVVEAIQALVAEGEITLLDPQG